MPCKCLCCCHHGEAIAKVHQLLLVSTDGVPVGHQPSDQANQQPTWTPETASKGCSRHHSPLPFVIITRPESRYSFAIPRRVHRRLSRGRHCSESVKPVPRLYYRDCSDQHKCRQLCQQGRDWHLISWEVISHSILLATPLHTTKWLTLTHSSPPAFSLSLC